MRKAIAASSLIAAALVVAPVPTASSAGTGPDRVVQTAEVARVSIKQQVIDLTNARRRDHGCDNLANNAALGRAAQKHSNKMAAANSLDHQLPGEPSLGTRVTRAGYRNWSLVGENIAYGYPTARSVVRGWMGSPSHRRNILNCRFEHIGIGLAYTDSNVPYWTQDFGRR